MAATLSRRVVNKATQGRVQALIARGLATEKVSVLADLLYMEAMLDLLREPQQRHP
jgi:hypothetical protein